MFKHISSDSSRAGKSYLVNEILKNKIQNSPSGVIDREGVHIWMVVSREYNEYPVLRAMLPTTWLNACRLCISQKLIALYFTFINSFHKGELTAALKAIMINYL